MCENTFTDASNLNRHRNSHKDTYEDTYRGKTLQSHTGEKPYKCDLLAPKRGRNPRNSQKWFRDVPETNREGGQRISDKSRRGRGRNFRHFPMVIWGIEPCVWGFFTVEKQYRCDIQYAVCRLLLNQAILRYTWEHIQSKSHTSHVMFVRRHFHST